MNRHPSGIDFLQWGLYEAQAWSEPLCSVTDLIQLHREEHTREVPITTCTDLLAVEAVAPGLERFIHLT